MRYGVSSAAAIFLVALVSSGCSQEGRDETINRVSGAAHELNGERGAPDVVREQRRKEKNRQNTQWTAENQTKYPEEYCLSQLETARAYASQLDVSNHKIAIALNAANRKIETAEAQLTVLSRFLQESKTAYRSAGTNNGEKVTINGSQLSKKEAQRVIVEAHQRIQMFKATIPEQKTEIRRLESKSQKIAAEQQKLARLSEKIKATLEDVRLKKMVDGENGIEDSLNAINDSMGALAKDYATLTLDDVLMSPSDVAKEKTFEAIIAE